MKKNDSSLDSYLREPCERCGSKRYTANTWKETIATLAGTSVIEYTQINCSNEVCQLAFDKKLSDNKRLREEQKLEKEASDLLRKNNSLLQSTKARQRVH